METSTNNVTDILKKLSGGKILDVGTGSGSFIPVIIDNLKDYSEVIGIDSTEKAIGAAKKNFIAENIKFKRMDAENMDFADNCFDTVCISNTLHHLPNIKIVLDEMLRVLKPGGIFIINEMFCDNQNDRQMSHVLFHHLTAEIDSLLGTCHNKTFGKQEIIGIANDIGLKNLSIIAYTDQDQEEPSKEYLDSLAQYLDIAVEKVKDNPDYENFKKRSEDTKQWIYSNGISGATELMVIGRK